MGAGLPGPASVRVRSPPGRLPYAELQRPHPVLKLPGQGLGAPSSATGSPASGSACTHVGRGGSAPHRWPLASGGGLAWSRCAWRGMRVACGQLRCPARCK